MTAMGLILREAVGGMRTDIVILPDKIVNDNVKLGVL